MTNGERLKQMFPELVFSRVSNTDCVCFDLYYDGVHTVFTGCAKYGWWDAEYEESETEND